MNKVVVNGYTYETDLDVKVGDIVELPTAYWLRDVKGDTWQGVVSSLDSNYDGVCSKVIKVVGNDE